MAQQINLYNPIFRRQKQPFSAIAMVQALALVVAGTLAVAFWAGREADAVRALAAQTERQAAQQRDQLIRLAAATAPENRSRLARDEIERLTAQLAERRTLLEAMQSGALGNSEGFSRYLAAFARQVLPGSIWLDLFWPLFGLGVAMGALITLRISLHHDRRHLLVACYGLQAAGVMLSVWWPSLPGFALGSLMLGLPFTAITLFAMQEARRLRPQAASSFIGLLTAAYGLGQIVGPPMVAWLLGRTASTQAGFTLSLEIAASALLIGAGIFGGLARRHPLDAPLNKARAG